LVPAAPDVNRDTEVRVVGAVIANLVRKYSKSGDQMATFVLEDLEASIATFVSPSAMRQFGALLEEDVAVCVRGRIDTRDDQPKLVCMGLTRPSSAPATDRHCGSSPRWPGSPIRCLRTSSSCSSATPAPCPC